MVSPRERVPRVQERIMPHPSVIDPSLARASIQANTAVIAPPLLPEIRLHLASEVTPLWRATERDLASSGLPPPFWAFAWAGGQALARFVLDTPEIVRGRHVL